VPAAAVRSPLEAIVDPDVVRRGEVVPLPHPTLASTGLAASGVPIGFSRSHAALDRPTGRLGEHNAEVYGEWLGYDDERIAELKAAGVL
jgi:crotonobetainyl-CoA:carnitine CoA-transferase CaiB-like acyl-CoA transferase